MKKNNNYIIFSSIDWTTHWQLHHQLTTSLVSSGNRVLFIDNTGIRSASISDAGRLKERIANWSKGIHGYSDIKKNLTVFSPVILPFPYSKSSLFFNKHIFTKSILRWIKASSYTNPIVISFLPTPLTQYAISCIEPKLLIYYCANNMTASSDSASKVKNYEDYFFQKSDIVFTAANVIQEYAKKFSNKVYYFPPGIDFDIFNKPVQIDQNITKDINKIPSPIVGFVGAIGQAIDKELIQYLAEKHRKINIVLIGPVYEKVGLLKLKNIHFLGVKEHKYLPYYIKKFDVGIIPYLCNEFTKGVYPSKINEYLAMGVPVVSTNLPEVRVYSSTFKNIVLVTNTYKDFESAVMKSINKNDSFKKNRIEVAKLNSWDYRYSGISKVINNEVSEKRDVQLDYDWKKNFKRLVRKSTLKNRITLSLATLLLIIFYTPLFWMLGNYLTINDKPEISDAIVVFSGDGEVSYRNLSYQKRALEAVELYKNNYAKKIFLSSGREQAIADVEMIKLYLVSKGVPIDSIYPLKEYPDSTYKNVIMTNNALEDNGIMSILFLTSPYHSLRSKLIWEKNAPKIKILIPKSIDYRHDNIKWSADIDTIRIVLYEYIAILYNWYLGRI